MTDMKIIVITGAGSGFGKLAAIELGRAGHKVYASMRDLAGHSKDKVEEIRSIASSEGIDLHPLQLDVREEPSCRSAADFVLSVDGRIDVVINNAAMMMAGLTESFRPEQLAQILDLNAISWLRVNRAFLPAMRRQNKGLLLYVGSGITQIPDPFTGPYAASKAAGDVLAQIMGLENSRYNIETVICMPGAYTAGTDHFKHAVAAADPTVADQYGKLAGLAQELADKLDATNVPGTRTDAKEVAEKIAEVVDMPHGTRPFRFEVDPQQRQAMAVAEKANEMRRIFFDRLGVSDLMSVPEN
ncbi:SDR family NAD(P)-dependent oxidoreductase [Rhizobium leguminosarum]|uniref:SDR family NAD(P)-dependent oxidoreductase n=1 Tax=Rhizobium leguminosarum TaxID=384 RepID=UPI001441B3A7|nr:SDR family NAD(P)-dependent oxidoreductase [Rhizobium leguminosarum]NKL55067.1 SDR family NAD(P)-dependent oxidoreductase [Rhizobium leguminosarum bv. viciae]